MSYFVYMLKCADGTLYTGTASDIEKRVRAHNHLKSGAKYTRARRPVDLIYCEAVEGKGVALSREAEIKRLTRTEKIALALSSHKLGSGK
ncbi:MAG TPA: GIY-YIG nuclease family protein [Candidatus Paceibacterota bacterium]